MPANFSAVSENEMTYVMGGSVADYLAPAMGKKEWSNFSKNLVTIIGNSYLGNFVNNTLGVMFSGNWGGDEGMKIFGENGSINQNMFGLFKKNADDSYTRTGDMNFGNKVMQVLGMASVVYTLGTTSAKVNFNDGVMGIFGE